MGDKKELCILLFGATWCLRVYHSTVQLLGGGKGAGGGVFMYWHILRTVFYA